MPCMSQMLLSFYHSRFFPHFFLSAPKVLLIWQPCPPQGHCALTVIGKRDLRSHCSTLIWSRCSFEIVSAISATSHIPIWIANFIFSSPFPLLSGIIYKACPSSLSKGKACGRKIVKRCWTLSRFISLHLSCQLSGWDFLLVSHNCKKEFFVIYLINSFFFFPRWDNISLFCTVCSLYHVMVVASGIVMLSEV